MKETIKSVLGYILSKSPKSVQNHVKEEMETLYWKLNLRKSGNKFYNGHFEYYYTDLFGLDPGYFTGKKILDIGCGPLGSLEWAKTAARRVGVDPLAEKYIRMNGGTQEMEYVRAGSEALPFEDGEFDVVSIFNALDHVENVDAAVSEAERVLASSGDLLLIVEIGHKPTLTEPHFLTEAILDDFAECIVKGKWAFAVNDAHNLYGSIKNGIPPSDPDEPAILCAHLQKTGARAS